MKLLHTLLLSSCITVGFAQIQGLDFYSYRMTNMFNLNPAYTNYEDGLTIYTTGLAQAKGVSNNTKTFTLGMYSKLSEKQGLGGGLITDSRGAFGTTKAWLSYAYTAKFNEDARVHLGVNAGAVNSSLNVNRIEGYEYIDQTDPTLAATFYNRTQFITGFGALFQWKDLDVSLSSPHLVATNSDILGYLSAYTQYTFKTKGKFKVIPSFSYQRVPYLGNVFSGFVQGTYNEMIWLKSGYQSSKNVYAMAGFNVENIRIGYSYRINTGLFTTVANGTHELTLGIKLDKKSKKSIYNPTLHEIDFRLTKLLNKKVTSENKQGIIDEVTEIKNLMKSTSINESTPEAAEEANELMKKIETKLITLQNNLNAQ